MPLPGWDDDNAVVVYLSSDEFHELTEDMIFNRTVEILLTFQRLPNAEHDLRIMKHFPMTNDLLVEFEGGWDDEGNAFSGYSFSLNGIEAGYGLNHLRIEDVENLRDLHGLEFCSGLISLAVSGEGCPLNLAAIQDLKSIYDISLFIPFDLESIDFGRLPSLKRLFLRLPDHVRDLKFLSGCRLKELIIRGRIRSLKGLRVDRLRKLDVTDNRIRTIRTLTHAYSLRSLTLYGNQITDYSLLKRLKIPELHAPK